MKRKCRSGFRLPGILAALLLVVTTLYTPKLNVQAESSEKDGVIVALDVNSEWDGGYVANVSITNNTDNELVNWKLAVDGVIEVSSIWNATLEENGTLFLPCAYNANVPAHGSVSFGYVGIGARTEVGLSCSYEGVAGSDEETNPEETNPEETNPEETNPEETNPEETNPEETNPEETIPEVKPVVDLVVKDAGSALPVKDTTVSFRSGWDTHKGEVLAQVVTDEEGKAVVELPEGNYTVELNRNGFKSAYANVVSKGDAGVQEVTIQSLAHTFRGDVYEMFTDGKGEHYPARDARIIFYSKTSGQLVAETTTDFDGHYEIRLVNDLYYAVYDEDNHKRVIVDDISGDAFEKGQYNYILDLEPVYLDYIYPMGTVTGSVVDTNGNLVGYQQARPLIKFNRIGLVGDEPVQAPDFNLYADLNPRYANNVFGDGTYRILLPVGKYQIWCSPADSGCDTAVSQIVEVKEGCVTNVPDIVLDRNQKIYDFPYFYNAHVQVIDIVTGKPIPNAKACVMFGGSNIYSTIGIINNPEYMYADYHGELEFEYKGAGIKLAVYADGYKERSFNVCASVTGENVYYCAMIPEDEPDPVWVW